MTSAAVGPEGCADGTNLVTLAGLRSGLAPREVGRLTAAFESYFGDLVGCLGHGKVTVAAEGILEPRLRISFRSDAPGAAPDEARLIRPLNGLASTIEVDRSEAGAVSVTAFVAMPRQSKVRDDETEPDLPSSLAAGAVCQPKSDAS